MTSEPLKILLVEDSDADAALILNEFKIAGIKLTHRRVQSPEEFLEALEADWDVILCDHNLPKFSAIAALSILTSKQIDIPCIIVSGSIGEERAVEMMRAGAVDYVLKDRLKRLVPAVTSEVQDHRRNKAHQLTEKELQKATTLVKHLKRFFPPQIADHVLSGQIEDPFTWHRNNVTVLFIDLRGFTDFSEACEPEDVMSALNDYYKSVAQIAHRHNGSVGHLAGDGIMIFFNDPVKLSNPETSAVNMALEAKHSLIDLCEGWGHRDFSLNFGIGIASGFATIGGIGTEGFWDYTVIGTVTNLASRLCSEARNGQILASRRFISSLETEYQTEEVGSMTLKGLKQPVTVYNIQGKKAAAN